ncbi:hypothetical protein GWD52_17440 [Enterobacteriaceae bacterium 4M9]|nr:hypothetical protein [Enterobacteriaceae bacterium 4M9]
MNGNAIVLVTKDINGKGQSYKASDSHVAKIKTKSGNVYLLKNADDNFAPENITLKRAGNDLQVFNEGSDQPCLILEGYFTEGEERPPVLLGMAEDGQVYQYIPLSGEGYETGYLMADGEMSPVALGGQSLGTGDAFFVAEESNDNFYPILFGLLGLTGLVGGGIAIAHHNRDKNDTREPQDTSPPTSKGVDSALDKTGTVKGSLANGDVTDEKRPQLSGRGEAGNLITIYDNGKVIGSTTVDKNGYWTYDPDLDLADGKHALTTTETDKNGNTSKPSPEFVIEVDTTAPESGSAPGVVDNVGDITGALKEGDYTDDNRPELSGKGEPGNTIDIWDNGEKIGSTVVDKDGNWTWEPEKPLTEGEHKLSTTETDPVGNTSKPSPDINIVVDTTPPTGSTTPPTTTDNVGNKTGPLTSGEATDDAKPELSGKGEPGNTIDIWDNGEKIGSTVVDENGNWTWEPEAPLPDGEHNLSTTETDKAGNTSEPSPGIDIVIDTTPPTGSTTPPTITDDVGSKTGGVKDGEATDDTKPELSGKGDPGNTIDIWDNGEKIGSTVVDGDGNWTWEPDAPLTEGEHNLSTTETDPAGNTSEPSPGIDIVVDTTPPTGATTPPTVTDDVGSKTGSVSEGESTDDTRPELSGKGDPGNTIDIWDNGEKIGSTVVDKDGNWTWEPEAPLTEGEHNLSTTETDPAGNTSEPSPGINIVVDTSTPGGSTTPPTVTDNVGNKTGEVKDGEATDDTQPELSGKGEPGNTIDIWDNGEKIGSTVVDEDGNWTWEPETPLTEGEHNISTTETNEAGNTSEPSPGINIVVDTTPPEGSTTPPTITDDVGSKTGGVNEGEATDDTRPELSGKGDPGNTIDIWDNGEKVGSTTVDENGNWTWTPEEPLTEGEHNLSTTETDPAGNTSEPSPGINIVVDTTAPETPTAPGITDNVGDKTGEVKDGEATDDTQPELSGKGDPGNTIDIWDNGEKVGSTTVDENGNWTWTPEEPLTEGEHNLSTTETDEAGNTSEPSPGINIVVDTTAPETPAAPGATDDVGSKTGGLKDGEATDDTQPELTGKGEPGSTIDIWDNGEKVGSTTVDENGNWSWTPEEPLTEGEHKLSTTETDEAGNTSEPSPDLTIIVDTTAPQTPAAPGATDNVGDITGALKDGDVTDDTQPELNGKGEPGNVVDIWDNGEKIGSTTVDENGNWSWTPEKPLTEGEHKLSTTETDEAGNTSAPSPDITLTVDTTAPDAKALAITGVNDTVGEITGNIADGGKTDDSRPTISGTGTAGDTIVLYTTDSSGKHEIGRATVDANGKWSIQPESPLLAGNNVLSATEVDAAGNSTTSKDYAVTLFVEGPSAPSIGSIVDNEGPITGALQKGDVTDDNTPTISGSSDAGALIRIYDNGALIGSTIADENGNWSYTPGTALKDGDHSLSVTATDSVGQTSEHGGEFNFSIDTAAPETVKDLSATDNEGAVQGPVENGGTTDDATPTLEGSAEPGSTVNIYDGDKKIGEVEVNDDGSWSWTPDDALTDGEHAISVTVTDKAGNESGHSDELVMTIDTTDPTAQITSLVDNVGNVQGNITPNGITDDTQPEIRGIAKADSVVKIYDGATLIGSTTSDADGNWSFTPKTALTEGSHSLTVTATDPAGNTSQPSGVFGFDIDTTAPTAPTINGAIDDVGSVRDALVNGSVTDDSTPTLHGSAEAGSLVTLYDNGALLGSVTADANGAWQFTPTTPLAEGKHSFTVTATDTAGNVSDKSGAFVLNTDYSAPDASNLAITGFEDNVGEVVGNILSGGNTDDTTPVISGTGTAGDTITVYTTVNGAKTLLGSATVGADGTWKLALTDSNALSAGVNSITAVETDPAGNSTSPTPAYVVTVYGPGDGPATPSINSVYDDAGTLTGQLQKGSVTDDNTPTLKGNGEAGNVIRIYDNGTLIGSTTVGSDGSWTFTPGSALKDGAHSFTVEARNGVGQVSDKSGEWTISIDTAAPNPVSDLLITDNVGEVQGAIKDGDTTDDDTPTLSGTAEPGSTVNIYDGDKKIGEADVGSDGKWSWTPGEALGDGNHKLAVSVTDDAGNESARTPGVTITVDTTGVEISITNVVDDAGSVTGNIAANGVTDDTTPTINGTGKAGSIVKVYDGSTLLGSTTVTANGTWSFTPSTALGEGKHTLTANATDATGNVSDDATFSLTVDTTAPTVPSIDTVHDDVGSIQGSLAAGATTDDPTPTLSGSAEAGSLVTVYDNGKAIGSVKAGSDGKWSYTPTSNLSEGAHSFTVTATDAAGNVSDKSGSFNLTTDYTAPSQLNLAITGFEDNVGETTGNVISGGNTDDTTPVISGTGTAGDTITVYTTVNGVKTLLGSATVGADGTWKLALTDSNALSKGVNSITAVETDPAGNSTSPSAAYVVTVYGPEDGPATPSINSVYDDAGTLTGQLQKGSVTDDNTPTLKGNGEAGNIIRIYDNGTLIGSTTVGSDGGWTFTPSPALKDGNHAFTADAKDSVGQVSDKSGEWTIVVDTAAPNPVSDLVITDNVGDVQGAIKDGDTTDDNTPTLSGTAEPGSTVNIYDGNEKVGEAEVGSDGKWSWTPSESLGDGNHKLAVSVTDDAGNESARTPGVTITVDTSGVEISITNVVDDAGSITGNIAANGVTDDTTPTINGTGKAGSIVKVYDGSTLLGSTTVTANGTWSFTPSTALGEGKHTLTANATDAAGNVSDDATFSLTVDTTAPTVPSIDNVHDDVGSIQGSLAAGATTDDPTPTLSGNAEAGSLVTVYDNGKAIGSVKAGSDGKWSYTPTSNLSEGAHSFTVTATDTAGNVSGKSGSFNLTTDYTAPDASKLAITGFEDNVGETTGNVINGGNTDDTTPVISGTGTAGDIITLYTTLNGTKITLGSTTVDASGKWTLALDASNELAGGTHSLTAVETDPAGNSTSPSSSYTVTVLTDVPAAPSINSVIDDVGVTEPVQKGAVTNDNTPTLNGTAGAGLLVRIYDNGTLIGSTTADSNGNWKFTPSPALKDGNHAFTADAKDSVGQVSDKSGEWAISIDTAAPNPVSDLLITDNVGEVQGAIRDGDTTDDNTPTLSGTAEPGSTVNIYDGNEKVGEAEVGSDGKWSWTPGEALGDGNHKLAVSVTDDAGNESARTPGVTITVDTTGVKISITNVVDDAGSVTGNITTNGVTDDTTPTINGTGKAGSIVKVYDGSTLLGSTTVTANGAWSFTPSTALGEGKHTLTANATDAAGNVSDDATFSLTVDTTAPTVPSIDNVHDDVGSIQGSLAAGATTDDPTPTLSGNAEAGSLVTVYDNGKAIGSVKAGSDGKWSYTPTSNLSEGAHSFTVTATDTAGNVSGKSGSFNLTTDYTAPDSSKLAITGFEDNVGETTGNVVSGGSTDDDQPVISGTGTAGDIITLYTTLNGTKITLGSTTVDASGKWTLALDASNKLAGGTHSLTAVETDPAGNSTSPSAAYTVTVVGDVPAAPSINSVIDDVGVTEPVQKGAVTNDNTPTLNGTAGAGLLVRIYDNGTLIGSTTADSNGNWKFTPSPALKDGNHAFTADAKDSVGQVSDKSGEWTIVVDTAAPNPVSDLVITDNVGDVQGAIKDGDTTDDNTPTLSGTAEPGSTVNIYDGNEKVGEAEVGSDGKWSWTPSESLGDGNHKLAVSVTDDAGNESARTPGVTITVDTAGVEISITNVVDDAGSVTGNIAANGVTDDTTPTINGTGKAGSIVKVYDGSTLLGSTTVTANGTWSFTPSTALGEGKHTLTANATDATGNVSDDATFSLTVDTTAPTVPTIDNVHDDVGSIQGSLAAGATTDDPTPTLSGNAEAGSLVTVYDNGKAIGSVKAGSDGKWSYTPTSNLSEGAHSFTVTATDAAGNVSGKSGSFNLTTDYTAPDSSKLAITGFEDNVGETTGNVVSGGSTDDTTPVISGTGTAGDIITLYTTLNGTKTLLGSTTVDASGKWTLTLDASNKLAAGTHSLTAVETDPAGNSTSPTPAYTVTVVGDVPAAPSINSVIDDVGVTEPVQKGAVTNDNTPTLNGTAGAGLLVRIYDNGTLIGSTTADSNGNWKFTPSPALKDGNHAFTADAKDSVGQVSDKSGEWTISIDTAAPNPVSDLLITDNVGEVQGAIKDGETTDDNTPTLSGTAEPGSTVNIYDGNEKVGEAEVGSDGKWNWTPGAALNDGNHKLAVSVTDDAGNESARTPGVTITVDTSGVEISITNVVDDAGSVTGNIAANGVTDDTTPTINGTGKAGSIVKVYDGSTLLGSTTITANGSWSFTPSTALSEGKHTLTANATDATGNVSDDATFSLTVDTTAPTAPSIDNVHDDVGSIQGSLAAGATTDDPTPTLSGTAEAGSLVIIYDGTTKLGSVTAGSDGKWSYTPTSNLSEGAHSFTVTATDTAGNVSDKSGAFNLTTDYTAPDTKHLSITGFEDDVGKVTGQVASGGSSDDKQPVISGTGTAGDTITVSTTFEGSTRVLGTAIVAADGKWTLALNDSNQLSEGLNNLTAVETDPAGNSTSPTPAYTVTIVGTTLETPTIDSVWDDAGAYTGNIANGSSTDDSTPTLRGTAIANGVVHLYDNGIEIGSTTADKDGHWELTTRALADGNHKFTAQVINSVGQSSDDSEAFDMTLDTVGPNVPGMTTTTAITTDTSHGLSAGDLFSHSLDATNNDLVTRDTTVTLNGTLSQSLKEDEYLQISFDKGKTWTTLLSETGSAWSYGLPEATASTSYDFILRVLDGVGNIAKDTAFKDSYSVVIDLDSPDGLTMAPVIDSAVSSNTIFTFDSTTYGRVEAGAIVSLVSDVNQSGTYQEGLDQVLGFAVAGADGSWIIKTNLTAGAHNLAFVVWDAAGNRSGMSAYTPTGVSDGDGVTLIEQTWGGTVSPGRGLNSAAVTINGSGGWSFAQSAAGTSGSSAANAVRVYDSVTREDYTSSYLAEPSTSNGADYNVNDGSYDHYINSMTFADINRDGYTDLMSQVSSYGNNGRTAYWIQNADGSWTPKALNQGTLNHLGGVIAYDREGDGYLDFVLADSEADSISFIKNVNGTLSYESNSGFAAGHPGGAIPSALSVLHEVGAVDIDNNGTVDITAHIDYNGAGNNAGNGSRGLGILYNTVNGNGTTSFSTVGYYANVFKNDGADDYGNYSISMTYADFNGDGWLDLFLSSGSKNAANSNESRIYLNDGKGNLLATDANALWFGDTLLGGTSLAVDWNHDGKMDIIEIPRSGTSSSPMLYMNNGNNNWSGGGIALTKSAYSNLTGAVAMDYDWDGSMDLILYRGNSSNSQVVSNDSSATTLLVKNTNIAADGTSLKIRIVDGNGINTFYSNTVKLYNSAGELVATQLINPQASGSSNSMGLVSFFGLDPNEVYSVQLLRITNGVADHVGASSTIGGYTNGTVNSNWGGLTTGKSHDAYVLTAESDSAANNTSGKDGIVGTGYNDTFFWSAGNDTYTGGGGWNLTVVGKQVWDEKAGLDTLDYSTATSAVTANLQTGVATGTAIGTDKLISIEGLIGTKHGDTFTDNAANNQFEGRGGNDTFYLTNGGNDVLMYKVLAGAEKDSTGGNGHDTVHGFHVGNITSDGNADVIDLSDMLDYNGSISFYKDDGVLKLDNSSKGLMNYLKVEVSGNDTIISIDRDGSGSSYGYTAVLTLADVHTDLVTLLQNNQIMV